MINTNKNDKNYVLEAFDYNFIIIISQFYNYHQNAYSESYLNLIPFLSHYES